MNAYRKSRRCWRALDRTFQSGASHSTALKAGAARVKRWSGLVLVGVGLWLLALAVWADFFARFVPV